MASVKDSRYQPLFFEYGENRENTSRTVHVLYVIVRIGCYFTKHRRLAGQGVYVLYRKVYSGLLGYGEQVQYRVGRAPHGNIESHRIEECRASSDVTGQYAFIAVLVISPAVLHDLSGSLYE